MRTTHPPLWEGVLRSYSATYDIPLHLHNLAGDIETNPGPEPNKYTKHDSLHCLNLNAQSIKGTDLDRSKINEFRALLDLANPDLMTVTETWLKDFVKDTEIADENDYNIYRKDRPEMRGGGVLTLVRKNIWSYRRDDLESLNENHNEIVAVEVRPNPGDRILIISAYRSQIDPPSIFTANLEELMNNAINDDLTKILLMGDFNYPDLTWKPDKDKTASRDSRDFLSLTNRYGLTQYNYNPSTDDGNILDLVLSNLENEFSDILSNTYHFRTRHYLLEFHIKIDTHKAIKHTRTTYNFRKGNIDAVKEDIRKINLQEGADVDDQWFAMKRSIIKSLNNHIPKVKVKNNKSPPWIDAEVVEASRNKKKALKKAHRTNKDEDWAIYKNHRNRMKNLTNRKYNEYISTVSDNIGNTPKKFWNLLSSRSKSRRSPDRINDGNREITDPVDKACAFNKYFASIFSTWNKEYPPLETYTDDNLGSIRIDVNQVQTELQKLDVTKAPGPDGIPTYLLKTCANEIAPLLTEIYNNSLSTSKLPTEWKRANITPVYKKGDKLDTNNYRPISLLPIVSKVLERCIYNNIIDHIRPNISPSQHGFLSKSSTNTQMLSFFQLVNNTLDNRTQTDLIYFDLSKAFDSVPHPPLIAKLKTFGIHDRLLDWFKDYLTDRKQRVTIDGHHSTWLPVTSGVPQGSILGPLLFLLYINDLPTKLNNDTDCAIFADDTKIGRPIQSPDDETKLQQDIDNLSTWSHTWGLKFNTKKCKSISICDQDKIIDTKYSMNQEDLEKVNDMQDLGITVSNTLKWKTHIEAIATKAERQLWMIVRTLGYQAPQKAKQIAYQSLVRPILEYGSPIWNPTIKLYQKIIEDVQRKATNFILCNPRYDHPDHIDYKDRLQILNMLPTSYRREQIDITQLLTALNDNTNLNLTGLISFEEREIGPRTRQTDHNTRIQVKRTNLQSTTHFFHHRVTRTWNSLPDDIKLALRNTNNKLVIKQHLTPHYKNKLANTFETNNQCTWTSHCQCNRC
jgi:hypothetical protein